MSVPRSKFVPKTPKRDRKPRQRELPLGEWLVNSVNHTAHLLDCSPDTVRKLISEGKLEVCKIAGKSGATGFERNGG
jgi:hypothetical protein